MIEAVAQMTGLAASRVELTDDAIIGALREMPGFIDVTVRDLREIYRRAYPRAVAQSLRSLGARDLMRIGVRPARPDMALVDAARSLVEQGVCNLPVIDGSERVIGSFAEADFLHRLHAGTTLQLLLRLIDDASTVDCTAFSLPVSAVMRTALVTLTEDAGCQAIVAAFVQHGGDSIPVTNAEGRLRGILYRECLAAILPKQPH